MTAPPYANRIDSGAEEIRVWLGRESAWRYARLEADAGLRRGIVVEPCKQYDLAVVRHKPVLLIALDDVSGVAVKAVAIQLLEAGAQHVAAISPTGRYRMFVAEAAA